MRIFSTISVVGLCAGSAAAADSATGSLFYTTFNGGQNVHRVDYNFNGTTFSLTGNTPIGAGVAGADGIVFTGDGALAIGGQGNHVNKVNPTTGALIGAPTTSNPDYHMMVAPDGTIWSSGIPGTPSSFNSTLTVNGTAHPLASATGTPTLIDSLAWTGNDSTKAFYTSSGASGNGNFGRVDLTTGITTQLRSALPAAHGMTFDPYTGTLILFGNNHITQIDPLTGLTISDFVLATATSDFDQGTVDGHGHIFAANNDGSMTFLDIASSKLVGSPDFQSTQFLASSLDDVAPLVGQGSRTVPDSLGFGSAALCLGGLCLFGWRKRKALASS